MFTQLVSDYCRYEVGSATMAGCVDKVGVYWSSLPESMLTLFMTISGGVNWEETFRPLIDVSIFAVMCHIIFTTIAVLAVVNVVCRLWSAPGCRLPAAAWRRWASSAAWRCWCRTSQNYRELSHGLLECESQKKIKKEEKKHQKKNKKELINSKTQDSLLEIKKHGPSEAETRSWDFPGHRYGKKKNQKRKKKDQDLFESS